MKAAPINTIAAANGACVLRPELLDGTEVEVAAAVLELDEAAVLVDEVVLAAAEVLPLDDDDAAADVELAVPDNTVTEPEAEDALAEADADAV